MREMHKWKDKVELSLDNRQIFFLFFGLSVIGCFVFALGIMTGRRIDWEPGQEVAAIAGSDSLAMLEAEAQDEHFDFESGLSRSDAEAIPPTRDPSIPPRDEKEVRAEKAAAAEQAKLTEQREAAVAEVDAKVAEQQQALANVSPKAKPANKGSADAKPAADGDKANEDKGPRLFTLQMKAFSRQEDADTLATKLRSNGHEVRIESHEVRGRTWHRVRLGSFDTWESALAAKTAFEKRERIIAYVVSL